MKKYVNGLLSLASDAAILPFPASSSSEASTATRAALPALATAKRQIVEDASGISRIAADSAVNRRISGSSVISGRPHPFCHRYRWAAVFLSVIREATTAHCWCIGISAIELHAAMIRPGADDRWRRWHYRRAGVAVYVLDEVNSRTYNAIYLAAKIITPWHLCYLSAIAIAPNVSYPARSGSPDPCAAL